MRKISGERVIPLNIPDIKNITLERNPSSIVYYSTNALSYHRFIIIHLKAFYSYMFRELSAHYQKELTIARNKYQKYKS